MAGTFKLNISKQVTEHEVLGRTQGFRLVMTATVLSGFADAGMFLFLRSAEGVEIFQAVCSPSYLVEVPLDTPDAQGFIRRANLDLIFPSRAEAQSIAQQIEDDLKVLCDEMVKLQTDLTVAVNDVIQSDE